MDDVKLANYIAGIEPGPIEAEQLDTITASALGLEAPKTVLLSDWTFTKISLGHPDIDFQDYLMFPTILSEGFVTRSPMHSRSGRRRRTIEIYYGETSDAGRRAWRVALKATNSEEVYVATFHHANWKELRRVYRRAVRKSLLVRDAKRELARCLSHHAS